VSRNLVVVPCKNEAGNIPNLIADFLANSKDEDELWLVEGGSSDDSSRVCSEYAEQFNSIHFINQIGRGKFGGVRTVIDHLIDLKKEGVIAIWDADHSIKFRDVRKALDLANGENTLVITERIGSNIEDGAMPRLNFFGNKVVAILTSLIFRTKVRDALSGTKVFPINLFITKDNVVLDFLDRDSYGDLSYFLLARLQGLKFECLSVDYYARVYGVSGLNRIQNGVELLQSLAIANKIIRSR
jgi:glycosyltransferase involved in cell wall biosynthesis